MARKQINIFNVSFLDLISGALGAVILLFIISAQLITEVTQELEALERLDVEVAELEDILEEAKNSIPKEVYEEIQAQIEQLKGAISELESQVAQLQEQLKNCEAQRTQLEQQIQAQQQQIEQQQQQIENLNQQMRQCEANMEKLEGEARFAVITMRWETPRDDVDLHVTDPSGTVFNYSNPQHAGRPGLLSKDDTSGPGFEVWQINAANPGSYKIEAVLYASKSGQAPTLETWFYYRNGTKQFQNITLTQQGERKLITSFRFNSDGTINF